MRLRKYLTIDSGRCQYVFASYFVNILFVVAFTQFPGYNILEVIKMNTKNIIRDRRIELGLTMKDVAAHVGVSEGTVSRWESGNIANMKRSRIYSLAEILQISPVVLIGDEEKNLPATGQGEREIAEGSALKEWEKDALQMLRQLQPEELAREMAYLKERVGGKDKQ